MNIAEELRKLADQIDAPDPYAELKKAHAEGKAIEYTDDDIYRGTWVICERPMWLTPGGSRANPRYRIKPEEPWTLSREIPGFRALRDGEEWHRQDFTKEMLEGGLRPLLNGEPCQNGDKVKVAGGWTDGIDTGFKMSKRHLHTVTKRPLPLLTPEQIAQGWKEHTGGENPAPGKRVIVCMRSECSPETAEKNPEIINSNEYIWSHHGTISDIIAYRVIEPKLIPLGPEDVPPGSVLRSGENHWFQVVYVRSEGVNICSLHRTNPIDWNKLKKYWQINRSIPLTGKWDTTAWEPCSKPESKEAAE